jgi:hypothetical protein
MKDIFRLRTSKRGIDVDHHEFAREPPERYSIRSAATDRAASHNSNLHG